MQAINPPLWPRPKGYNHAISAVGRQVFVAGQIGWNPQSERFEATDIAGQVRQALHNMLTVLAFAGAEAQHIVRLTWYVTDKQAYLSQQKAIGTAYVDLIGKHFPAMTLVQVAALAENEALVEIEATAIVPD